MKWLGRWNSRNALLVNGSMAVDCRRNGGSWLAGKFPILKSTKFISFVGNKNYWLQQLLPSAFSNSLCLLSVYLFFSFSRSFFFFSSFSVFISSPLDSSTSPHRCRSTVTVFLSVFSKLATTILASHAIARNASSYAGTIMCGQACKSSCVCVAVIANEFYVSWLLLFNWYGMALGPMRQQVWYITKQNANHCRQ